MVSSNYSRILMKHKRNTKGIKAAAQQKRQEALDRANSAIAKLKKSNKPISFVSVAKEGQVSKSLLYKEDSLRKKIELLREQDTSSKSSPKSRATKASHDVMVRTLRKRNAELRQDLKNLKDELESVYGMLANVEEERDQLKAQLEIRGRKSTNRVAKSSSMRKSSTKEELVDQIKDICGTKLSPDIIELIQISDSKKVEKAVAALKSQVEKVKNPVGWLRRAIEEGWEPASSSISSEGSISLPSGFEEWYAQAVEDGFLQNMPINELGSMSGEIQVRVNRPDFFGAPYTLTRWTQAKLEWEAQQQENEA